MEFKVQYYLFIACMMMTDLSGNLSAQINTNPEIPETPEAYLQLEKNYQAEDYATCIALEPEIMKIIADRTDTIAANALSFLADSYYYEGKLDSSIILYERKLAMDQSLFGYASVDYEETLADLAATVAENGKDLQKAIRLYVELMPLDRENYGVNSMEYVQTLNETGKLYVSRRQYAEAESLYDQLLQDIDRKNSSYPVVLNNQADVFIAEGKYSEAKKTLGRALEAIDRNAGKDNLNYAATLYNLSRLYYSQGDYAGSELMNLESLKIIKKIGANDHIVLYAANLNQLGVTYTYMGLYDEAGNYLRQKEKIDKALYGENHPVYAITLNNLANLYTFQKKYEKAENFYKRSMQIKQEVYGENSIDYALSLNNLAYLYMKMNRPGDAIPLYKRSAEIYSRKSGEDHPDYARSLYNLGNACFADDKIPDAENNLMRSLAIRKEAIGIYHPRYAESLHSLALLKWDQGQFKEAEKYFGELFGNYDHQVRNFFTVLSEQEKAAFFNNKLRTGYEQYDNYVIDRAKEEPRLSCNMYDYQLATKGLILYSTDRVKKAILSSGDTVVINKYNRWLSLKEQIAGFYSETKESSVQSEKTADSLNQISNQIEKELNVVSGSLDDAEKNKVITWKDIQKTLGKDEAAMEIIRLRKFSPTRNGLYSDSIYYVGLIVTSRTTRHPEMVVLRNGLELEKKYIAVYRNSIKFKLDDPYSYDVFWKPFTPYLKGIKKIYISVDGIYNLISLNSLFNPATGQYILDQYEIDLLTNTRDIISLKEQKRPGSTGQIYLFGYPNYNMGLTQDEINKRIHSSETVDEKVDRGLRGMDRSLRGSLRSALRGGALLQELPGTRTEINNIARIYEERNRQPKIYLQNQALEESVKSVVNPKALHIATHGFFLSDQDLPESDLDNPYTQNPLLRSGLIMAGVNNFLAKDVTLEDLGGEDGILTAYEAMNMNLENTDMVVLSACETGMGEIRNGEGVYGLQRAFEIAGAKSMIMSLWSVDDDATQELMSDFYENWQKSGDKKAAFKLAQQSVKDKYKYPFFWGAFVLVGD